MIRTTLSVSMLVIVVLAIRKILYYKISRNMQYALWLVIPIYMVLSIILQVEIPVQKVNSVTNSLEAWNIESGDKENTFNVSKEVTDKEDSVTKDIKVDNINISDEMRNGSSEEIADVKHNSISWKPIRQIFNMLFYSVTCIITTYVVIKNLIFLLKCRKKRKFYAIDPKTALKIFILDGISTPFLIGKSMYVSFEMIQNAKQFQYMVLHEYCHWKHGDSIWRVVKYVVISCFWYNPLLWVASHYEECDREMACDESVINLVGKEQATQYGDTLLCLAKYQMEQRRCVVASNMGGGKEMLKERILYIISNAKKKKVHAVAAVVVIVGTLIGTLISVTNQAQATNRSEKTNVIREAEEKSKTKESIVENNYYNAMKSDGKYIYFSDDKNLMRCNVETGESAKIADGYFKLGTITATHLYYTKIEENTISIGSISISDLHINDLYTEKNSNAWGFSAPYMDEENKMLYCEEAMGAVTRCHAYKFNDDMNKLEEENGTFFEKAISISKNISSELLGNYIKSVTDNQTLYFQDYDKGKLFVYDTNGKKMLTIKNYACNLMDADGTFVYTDNDYNIHLCEYKKEVNRYTSNIIFKGGDDISYINYGTYDVNGIYGYYTNNKKTVVIQLTWDGEMNELYSFTEDKKLSMLSAFGNSVSFLEGDQFKLINY